MLFLPCFWEMLILLHYIFSVKFLGLYHKNRPLLLTQTTNIAVHLLPPFYVVFVYAVSEYLLKFKKIQIFIHMKSIFFFIISSQFYMDFLKTE